MKLALRDRDHENRLQLSSGRWPGKARLPEDVVERLITGRVQRGEGDATRWLSKFDAAYSRKLGVPLFPGSLNIALPDPFDWFAPEIVRRTIAFDRAEYGGERDILLVPCLLLNLACEPAWLWTTTTAAHDRSDPCVIEIIAALNLRDAYHLIDGSMVQVQLLDPPLHEH